jgi:hypothetical protein
MARPLGRDESGQSITGMANGMGDYNEMRSGEYRNDQGRWGQFETEATGLYSQCEGPQRFEFRIVPVGGLRVLHFRSDLFQQDEAPKGQPEQEQGPDGEANDSR